MHLCGPDEFMQQHPHRFQQLLEAMHRCFPPKPCPSSRQLIALKDLCRYGLVFAQPRNTTVPPPSTSFQPVIEFLNPEIPHTSSKYDYSIRKNSKPPGGTFNWHGGLHTFKINSRYAQFKNALQTTPGLADIPTPQLLTVHMVIQTLPHKKARGQTQDSCTFTDCNKIK